MSKTDRDVRRTSTSQYGFTTLELVIIILCVIILVGLVWLFH